jgi:hypothetical protein
VRQSYEYFRDEHAFTTGQAEFLLKLENPLELMSDKWSDRIGDLRGSVSAVFHDQERTLRSGSYALAPDESVSEPPRSSAGRDEKTSVLDLIRQAARDAKDRPAVLKDSPGRNNTDPDL